MPKVERLTLVAGDVLCVLVDGDIAPQHAAALQQRISDRLTSLNLAAVVVLPGVRDIIALGGDVVVPDVPVPIPDPLPVDPIPVDPVPVDPVDEEKLP